MSLIYKCREFINWFYRNYVWRNHFIHFDFTSDVFGVKNIKVTTAIYSGKHFWLQAIEQYEQQSFYPRIVFKGNFNASDFCHIGATHYIEIGNNVLFGSKVYVTDHGHGIYSGDGEQTMPEEAPAKRKLDFDKEVVIGDNVWIGDNVTILPNVHIGQGCVIGANAVVSRDVPPYCIAVGIPAKVIKKYNFQKKKWTII